MRTQAIKQLPAVLQPDVFRSLQLLPGVKAASDFSSGIYVRGGGPDQTLIFIDRNPVYNPSHFFGFFSTFNPDAIKDVRLLKGGYPAEYGGRLGAVLDVYNKDGNRKEMEGGVSVGLLSSRAILEGPYPKGSWMLAVRRSTLEPLLSALESSDVENIPDRFYFYDVNGKVNFEASRNDQLSFAFYSGRDKLDMEFLEDARFTIGLGNTTWSATWTRLLSDRMFGYLTLTSSRYGSFPEFVFSGTNFARDNRVFDTSAKGDVEYAASSRHEVKAGFWTGNFVMRLEDTFDDNVVLDERIQTAYTSVYLQDTYRPSPEWMVRTGIRGSYFQAGDYLRLEPRFSVEYRPVDRVRLQAGYGRYYQFLTLITSEVFSAFDMWLTTDEGVGPAFGDQFVGGVKTILGNDLYLDVEGYYRTMRDLFELDPFIFDAAGLDYPELFRFGDGYAWGTEVLLEKPRGRLTGFLGYTLGRTRRRFPNINDFNYYAPKYDRTHDLNLVLNYRLGRGWLASGVFTYATGQAYTEPSQQFRLIYYPLTSQPMNGLVSHYNRARLPAYHRLDLGISKQGGLFGIARYELQLQLINAYSRSNIWFYFFEFEEDATIKRTEVPQIPIPLPNIAFSVFF